MSAVLAAKTDYPDRYPVPYVEKKPMSDPAPKPDLLIVNIQKDVTDLRADLRVVDGHIHSLRERFEKCREDDKRTLDARFEKVDDGFDRIDARFEKAEQCREEDRKSVDARLEKSEQRREEDRQSINARFDKIDQQREEDKKAIDARFEKVDTSLAEMRTAMTSWIDKMTDRIDGTYKWIVTLFVTGLGGLAALGSLMVHGFKWL